MQMAVPLERFICDAGNAALTNVNKLAGSYAGKLQWINGVGQEIYWNRRWVIGIRYVKFGAKVVLELCGFVCVKPRISSGFRVLHRLSTWSLTFAHSVRITRGTIGLCKVYIQVCEQLSFSPDITSQKTDLIVRFEREWVSLCAPFVHPFRSHRCSCEVFSF